MTHAPEERPIDYDVPEEEGIEPASVEEDLEEEPEEKVNFTDLVPEESEDS